MSRNEITRRTALKLGGGALVVGGLGAATASAQPGSSSNAVFDLDFSTAADAADNTAGAPGWVVDRQAPDAWSAVNGELEIDIDESGPTSGFYGYQGKKYQDAGGAYWDAGPRSKFSYRFYIDPAWESDGVGQQTGVWPVLGDANGNITAYPILEYQDSTANEEGEAGFRVYVYETDGSGAFTGARWEYIGLPRKLGIDPEEGGWVDVEAQLHPTSDGAALKWRVNGKLVADERDYSYSYDGTRYEATHFLEFIVNSANFGVDQQYYYDDVTLTEPGRAGNGQ